MDKQLTFQQFKEKIKKSETSIENLGDYVQFDPKSPIPKLRFKFWDWHYQAKHEGYDVDRAVYKYTRALQEGRDIQAVKSQSNNLKSVVAEGDSWFRLPDWVIFGHLYPHAIADLIEKNGQFNMYNIADWGHTLAQICKSGEYMKKLIEKKPDFFMLSAGGNDIRLCLKAYVDEYGSKWEYNGKRKSGQTWLGHLVNHMADYIHNDIQNGYKTIFDNVTKNKNLSKLKVFCHGYDYPRVHRPKDDPNEDDLGGDDDKNRWIVPYLDFLGISHDKMDALLRLIVDLLNDTIKKVANSYQAVKFINLREVTAEHDWMDDMHPDEEGFEALAEKFEKAMDKDC